MKVVNKSELVKVLVTRENTEKVIPELVLNKVKSTLLDNRTAVTANIQNIEPILCSPMKVVAKILNIGQMEEIKHTKKTICKWGQIQILILQLCMGIKNWKFIKNFHISNEDSSKINTESIDLDKAKKYILVYVTSIAFLLVMLMILIVYLILKRKNKV